jgi:hypothetical protein
MVLHAIRTGPCVSPRAAVRHAKRNTHMNRFNHPSAPNTGPEQKPEQLNRRTTPASVSLKKALALSAVPLALLFGAAFQSSNSVPGQLQAIQSQLSGLQAQVASLANKGPRRFYLTEATHNGAEALSACAVGYHMASLWEVFDTSNLRYDTDLGFTLGDSGFAPPIELGWIRTGNVPGIDSDPGSANCNAWTSAGGLDGGTIVRLAANWRVPSTIASPWNTDAAVCAIPRRVWCVQD